MAGVMLDVRRNHVSSYQLLGFPKRVRGVEVKEERDTKNSRRERERDKERERVRERERHINVVIT